ncbi:hypothetical protein ACFYRY_15530 [Streptomyces sp. NPDC005263]|uniref:hypothetical protein n=1 Tax=Streptomyces sp. NPDC005263 TaxID=3364711 RepID=UPI00369A702E
MGERQNGNRTPGRQRVRPGSDTGPGSASTLELEDLLGAALRGRIDDEAESRAVAAFRVARDTGAHRARTRRRDDWRPRERRWGARSVRATLSVVLASLTLGGVAFAAIGTAGGDTHGAQDESGRPHPAASAAVRPSAVPSPTHPGSSAVTEPSDRPVTAKDTLAHCRAYAKVESQGKALDSTAWQRLVTAAGSEANVRAYCAERVAGATTKTDGKGKTDGKVKTETDGKDKVNPKGEAESKANSQSDSKAEPKAQPKARPTAGSNAGPKAEKK